VYALNEEQQLSQEQILQLLNGIVPGAFTPSTVEGSIESTRKIIRSISG